ncbi:MAG TPA: putative 2OG-Fe(II) oxygenase [Sphingomicrobium sp.]|nr:putative 2OG-Fe(II) oxygenase [Sphingomicrobium sp.]
MPIPISVSKSWKFDDALAAYEAGERETLLAPLERAMEATAGDPRLWHLHGLILREMGRHEEALLSLRKAAQMAPGSARIAHALAQTLLEAGLPSIEAFGRAIQLAPAEHEVISGLAASFIADGEPQTALAGLEKIVGRSPHWVKGHVLLSHLRWMQADRETFTRSFDEALEQFPENLELRREHLIALMHADRHEEALRAIAKGRLAMGEQPLFAINEAMARSEMGETELAERLFEPFVDHDDPTLHVRRTRLYLRAGRPEEAARVIEPWLKTANAFMFWPYASLAWRQTDDQRWRWLEGDESFVGVYDMADRLPPLDALAARLRKLHTVGGHPLGQSLRGGTQTDGNLFLHIDPLIVQLREAVRATVAEHVAKFPASDPDHPLLGPARDSIGFKGAWSVRLHSHGHHANHIHPEGWISSALYVVLPPDIGKDDAGILTLGEAKTSSFPIELPPIRTVEPKPGRLALFPSYMWHGTRPFGEGERITIAFDVARREQGAMLPE